MSIYDEHGDVENDRLHQFLSNKKTTFNFHIFLREDHQLIRLQNSERDETRHAGSDLVTK